LLNAIKKGASDIHVEPYEKKLRVRYRIDGVLIDEMQPPLKLEERPREPPQDHVVARHRRAPAAPRRPHQAQDGQGQGDGLPRLGPAHDLGREDRLRLLDKSNLQLDMTKLGFDKKPLEDFKWAISQPWGMVLVTGPTGSGKTTTLYSGLSELNQVDVNISTAEDPVEYNLPGINQVQMHDEIGLNFAAALRSFLRQDPDIIMVGEIRDFETAEIAVKAALTGHMVLSTLHTNDAPATISRLLNMGVEPFLITASRQPGARPAPRPKGLRRLQGALAHRGESLLDFGFSEQQASTSADHEGHGVQDLQRLGLQGPRRALRGHALQRHAEGDGAAGRLDGRAQGGGHPRGMKTLRMAGIEKIIAGTTTVEEVGRVTMGD
jgi:type IV pilus assembly protein PilB